MLRFIYIIFYCCTLSSLGYASEDDLDSKIEIIQLTSPTECYTVIDELGEGAFGKVYAVVNSKGEKFALKSYKSQTGLEKTPYADPAREFQRGQFLHHPSIIKSFELFTHTTTSEEMTHNLVIELVEGKTLHNSKNRTLQLEQSITATLHLIDALRYALSLGYVHVDLHGGNLMLNRDLELKLVDLASFFTFEELYAYFKTLPKTESTGSTETQTAKSNEFKNFIANNPALMAQFQCDINSSEDEAENREWTHNLIHAYYFNQITDIVIKILAKSNLDRQTRLDLRTRIKQLAWNYEEDVEEGQYPYLDEYVDSLVQVLQVKTHF